MPKTHTIQAGDSTESVAYDYGLFWETVWNFAGNADLKALREDPNILEEGDVLVVPDKRPKDEAGATNQRHRFRRKGVPSVLRVRLLDQGKARVGLGYTLEFGDKKITGQTDGDGWVRCYLMPDVAKGSLTLATGEVYLFDIGTVRPSKSLRGVQNRLRNLGDYSGPIDGQMNDDLREALERFQLRCKLEVTGEADAATEAALRDKHLS
jgi:N-acetylmuramoyl-L-alanine amidase